VHGRVPFALVAVLLVLSASVSAMYLAAFAHDAVERRLREAQLDALAQVTDAVHAEVQAQAEVLALQAIDRGIEGLVNESRIAQAFREAFAGYVAEHFPRTVRSVTVHVSAFDGALYLVRQRVEDAVPPEDVRGWRMNGTNMQGPDPGAPEAWALVDRLAYFGIAGYVNYTLTVGGFTLRRSASLDRILPVPAPFLEAKVEQAVASGRSDLVGIGRTVKAIVATLVQLRVLQGFASPVKAGTTTRGVLTPDDVALAVNLAILLEEVRRFRSFDRDAAVALDAAYGRPELPADASPPGADRTWTSLLERYAAKGSVDPVDLYALHRGLDVERLPVGALLAQAVAALADDAVLKHLDYLGLTPLADWLVSVGEGFAATFEAFLRWLAGAPEREVAYVHQFLRELLLPTAGRTTFLGPASIALPERTYAIVDGSSAVNITVPAYGASVPFPWRDLVAREFGEFWAAHYPDFEAGVRRLHAGIRDLTNDVAARLAEDAAFVDALGGSAEPLDPNDGATFLAVLAARIEKAVDEAIERLRSDPAAMDAMIAPLWERAKELVADLVDLLVESYPTLADEALTIAEGERALADDVWTRASLDSDFAALGEDGRNALRTAIEADVADSGWVRSTFASRRAEDVARWSLALAAVNETVLPGTPTLRERLREAAVGVGGWLLHARSAMRGLLQEALGQEALAAHVATRLDPFLFRDVPTGRAKAEPFRVHHEPGVVREGGPDGLRIEIVDPATVPLAVDTPNVHYTRPFERSTRPFTTQWTVRVSGLVQLRVETVDRVLFGPDGL
ncbi:MAG: hypothetical protein HY557_08370, partial [Euryarchaeota archaeon]|nr:hypothetical protein [Euryarchaeota archaeon]